MSIKNLLFFFALIPLCAQALEISDADKQLLAKGEMVKSVVWKEGHVWPEVNILVVFNHTPAENLTEFLKFNTHKKYIPDMVESKIIKTISPTHMEVYFEMKMPWPVNKSNHTTNNIITVDPDGTQRLTWNLIKADMLKATDGFMAFHPYEGKSLLEYKTLIVPNSSFAGMFKNRVEGDVVKSVTKIKEHLDKVITKQKKKL